MSDLRDSLPPRDPMRDPADPLVAPPRESGIWGWAVGGLVAMAIVVGLLFVFNGSEQTASNGNSPAVTTGQATPPVQAPAAANTPSAPATENTGSR